MATIESHSLEELAGLKIDEVTNDGNLIVASRNEPPISDEDKRELIGHSVRRQVRRRNYVNKDANLERETPELTPDSSEGSDLGQGFSEP